MKSFACNVCGEDSVERLLVSEGSYGPEFSILSGDKESLSVSLSEDDVITLIGILSNYNFSKAYVIPSPSDI